MKSSTILGFAMLAALLAAAPEQAISRGGGGGGGGHGGFGGDFGGGDRGYSGGGDAWHGGGADAVGGSWHNDGYHADAYWSGYGGAAAVNHYYANGCYNCAGYGNAGWASATALATGYAIGSTVVTPPSGAACQHETVVGVHYYVCGTTWFRPSAGNNGLYYKVVSAPR